MSGCCSFSLRRTPNTEYFNYNLYHLKHSLWFSAGSNLYGVRTKSNNIQCSVHYYRCLVMLRHAQNLQNILSYSFRLLCFFFLHRYKCLRKTGLSCVISIPFLFSFIFSRTVSPNFICDHQLVMIWIFFFCFSLSICRFRKKKCEVHSLQHAFMNCN